MTDQTRPKPQLPTRVSFKTIAECSTLGDALATQELQSMLRQAAPKFLDAEAMLRTWQQAVDKTPLILKCDLKQSLGAFMSLAFLGLVPNTHLNLAHLIPYRRMVWNPKTRQRDIETYDLQVIIGFPGYIELAHRADIIRSLHCDVVYDRRAENFSYSYGSNQHLSHEGMPHGFIPKDVPDLAYAYVRLRDQDEQFEVMNWWEIERIRARSQGYRTAMAAKEQAEAERKRPPPAYFEAPWVRDPAEMAKKTPLRRLMKWLPKCPELRAASALEDAQDRGNLDFGPVIEGKVSPLEGGVPMAEPDPEPSVDPGSAFGDRRPALQSPSPKQPKAPPPEPPPPEPPPPEPPSPDPKFEAVLVDAAGEIADEVFSHPVAWARAFLFLWSQREPGSETALREHNADALRDAAANPIAAGLLAEIDEPQAEAGEQNVQPDIQVVQPPQDRGRLSWSGYLKAIRAALDSVPSDQFPTWLMAQKAMIETCPMAQRVLVVKAIGDALTARRMHPPAWMSDLLRKPAKADADAEWIDARIVDLSAAQSCAQFDAVIEAKGVREMMARLGAEKPALYARADAAFSARYRELLTREENRT